MTPSRTYDHNPAHYRFLRHHTGAAPVASQPVSGWGVELLRAAAIAALVASLWLLATIIS